MFLIKAYPEYIGNKELLEVNNKSINDTTKSEQKEETTGGNRFRRDAQHQLSLGNKCPCHHRKTQSHPLPYLQ